MRAVFGLIVVLFFGCGPAAVDPPSPQIPLEAPQSPEPPEVSIPSVELHEWGLVDVDLESGVAELATGPGQPVRPMISRKPVVYAHLTEGERATVSVRAHIPGGSILEYWPAGQLTDDSVAWSFEISRGACAASLGMRRETTCTARDGFCEVEELPRYVTDDHDCIRIGEQEAPLLFYRASANMDALPLRVSRAENLEVTVTGHYELDSAPRPIVRLSTAMGGPERPGHITIARASRPDRGESVQIPVGDIAIDPTLEREAMTRTLMELGLTASEARAFLAAWGNEFFGANVTMQDTLLYWLSPNDVARFSLLETSPANTTKRRAFLVRVNLGGVTTAAPSSTR